MSVFKIGLIAIIFLLLNLVLVNMERVAHKIRDYGYSNFILGAATAKARVSNTIQKRREQKNSSQEGGFREVVVFDANVALTGIKNTLAGQVQNAVNKSGLVPENVVPKEITDKLTLILIADLVNVLSKNKDSYGKLLNALAKKMDPGATQAKIQEFVQKVYELMESDEYLELKKQYYELAQDREVGLAFSEFLGGVMSSLPETNTYQLYNDTQARERENFGRLYNNLRVNLEQDLEKIEVQDKSAELSKLLGTQGLEALPTLPTKEMDSLY